MTKKLIIIGASGFGREVAWLIERINNNKPTWEIVGFLDDNSELKNKQNYGYPILDVTDDVRAYKDCYFVCAIGASKIRKQIINKIKCINSSIKFATLIDPTVEMSKSNLIGEGSIICAHTIITVNANVGEHVILNLDCTVGHEAIINDFTTVYPSVNISGNVDIGNTTEIGTGTQIIQGIKIGSNSIIGAGATVIRDIPNNCTAVGSPAKPIKFFDGGTNNA